MPGQEGRKPKEKKQQEEVRRKEKREISLTSSFCDFLGGEFLRRRHVRHLSCDRTSLVRDRERKKERGKEKRRGKRPLAVSSIGICDARA